MQANFKKDFLPHILGIVSFYLLVLLYFSPVVFEGKMIFQGDILQWEGSAKEILDYREETGEEALWTNRMFGGMPAYLVSLEPAGDISNVLLKIISLGLPHPINGLFVGMVGMYMLLLSFRIRLEIAVMGAWAFAFNTFNLLSLEAGHNAKIWALCLLPLILLGIHLAFGGKRLLGVALTAFGVMLQLRFNHLQITYYTLIVVLIYGLVQLISAYKQKELPYFGKILALLLLGAVLAVGANAGRLLPILEYGKYSTRGSNSLKPEAESGLDREYAFRWSQGKLESLTLLVPNFYGGASQDELPENSATEQALRQNGISPAEIHSIVNGGAPTYWGDQPGTGGPIYGGAIMIFLALIGALYAPKNYRIIFLSVTILFLMLSWGKNLQWFNYTLFEYLPGYNKFRAVSMALGVTLFAVPVLACLGLEKLLEDFRPKAASTSFWTAYGIVGGILVFLILFGGLFEFRGLGDANFPDWLATALREDRHSLMRSDAIRSLVFVSLSAALIFLLVRRFIKYRLSVFGIALLVILDVWLVDKRYLNHDSFVENPRESFFAARPAELKIMQDEDYFRVLNIKDNTFNEARTSYRFNSIGGYHGAKMGLYQSLIEEALSPEINEFVQKAREGNFDYEGIHVLNMLNTRYIIAGDEENAVFRNDQANGPAWFPQEVLQVATNEDEIKALRTIDTKSQAIISAEENGNVSAGRGKVELLEYKPNALNYHVDAEVGGLVVFSEIYYPAGWKAYVDGQETEILRVNYLLRGLVVPQGSAEVSFRFEPQIYYNSAALMVVMQYLVVLLLVGGIVVSVKKNLSINSRKP